MRDLNELQCQMFVKAATKTKFNLARLPPTRDAARLHDMRTYHQVQTWLREEKDPLEWGWVRTPLGLFPPPKKDATSASLLKCTSCNCKKGAWEHVAVKKLGRTVSPYANIASGNLWKCITNIFGQRHWKPRHPNTYWYLGWTSRNVKFWHRIGLQ